MKPGELKEMIDALGYDGAAEWIDDETSKAVAAANQAGINQGRNQAGKADLENVICQSCGISFTPTRKGQRYHAKKCADRARMKRWRDSETLRQATETPQERICQGCGISFVPTKRGQRYHTRQCSDRIRQQRARHPTPLHAAYRLATGHPLPDMDR